jgi:hypothetical protein
MSIAPSSISRRSKSPDNSKASGITITPITDNNINDKTPFIIIKLVRPGNILHRKYVNNDISICGINSSVLANILSERHIPNVFVQISDIMVHNSRANTELKILLVNKTLSISKVPNAYEKIMRVGKGFIWKPVRITFPDIFTSIGLIYSPKKPSREYRIIDANCVINADDIVGNFASNHLIVCNEYNMFVTDYDERKTIDIQRLQCSSFTKLYEKNDDELANISDNDINTLELIKSDVPIREKMTNMIETPHTIVSRETAYYQLSDNLDTNINNGNQHETKNLINIMPDGRVEVNNECISSQNGNDVNMIECVNSPMQEWQFNSGNIIHRDTGKCLSPSQPFSLVKCGSDSSSGSFMDSVDSDVKFPKWHKKFGKNVVLVSSNNPWYINKNITIPMPKPDVLPEQKQTNSYYTYTPRSHSIFKPNNLKKILKTQPGLGVEPFDATNGDKNNNTLLKLLLCIFAITIAVLLYYVTKN